VTTPICGYVAVWGVTSGVVADDRGARHRLICERGALDRWLALELAVPLLVQHHVVITPRGFVGPVGAMRHFRPDPFGLLALGELDDNDAAAGIEQAIRDNTLWAFSCGYATNAGIPLYDHGLVIPTVRMTQAALREVSVTDRPGVTDCKILGLGDEAQWIWDYPDLATIAHAARTTVGQ
jgi:HK97 family phage prohead protease